MLSQNLIAINKRVFPGIFNAKRFGTNLGHQCGKTTMPVDMTKVFSNGKETNEVSCIVKGMFSNVYKCYDPRSTHGHALELKKCS